MLAAVLGAYIIGFLLLLGLDYLISDGGSGGLLGRMSVWMARLTSFGSDEPKYMAEGALPTA